MAISINEAMVRANSISLKGLGSTWPNPIVGAVLLSPGGEVLSEGFHQRGANGAVGDHAEVVALKLAGERARGAVLVVTLEPCNHHGKTPPCTDAIIAAGVAKVIYAVADPNPAAQGGHKKLKSAGIDVVVFDDRSEIEAANRAWLFRMKSGRPYVSVKVAATMDGFIASADGTSKWITSKEARADVAVLRNQCDAIVTGTGTVLADNPQLTVRGLKESETHHPVRIVVGSREVPKDAVVRDGAAETQFVKDIAALEAYLRERRFNRVLVEAGPTLTSSLLKAGLVNELYLYQAPSLLGSGRSMVEGLGISTLSNRIDMKLHCSRIIEGESRTLKSHFTFNDELVSEVC